MVYRLFAQTDMMLALISEDDPKLTKHEVDLLDAIYLTYLRLRYPDLYRSLPGWKAHLINTSGITRGPTFEEDPARSYGIGF
ncbi:hypothetical protein NJ76_27765 [Rhodococcus sp. IITR03]|nr:hypothetical protein NJ76_27765 [Rhodococcus sp. IITR03]